MFLKLEKTKHPMKIVYFLSEKLKANPEYMNLVQALTLDNSKPYVGLNGTYGLLAHKNGGKVSSKEKYNYVLFLEL